MENQYVLLTDQSTYFVEYLIGELVLSHSVTKAMVINSFDTAFKFKQMLWSCCNVTCSVNTYIV